MRMLTVPGPSATPARRQRPVAIASVAFGVALLGYALSADFPRAGYDGFTADEATYYSLAHSLAWDFDFAFTREDLIRVWEEFPAGPEGIFLKRGKRVRIERAESFPYVEWVTRNDRRRDRLYYGKAYIYPLVAAPFVRVFGTNGFLVLHAILMTLNFAAACVLLVARGSRAAPAILYALAFLGASIVPLYFIWLMPEIFNFSLVLYAFFLWGYKEAAPPAAPRADSGEVEPEAAGGRLDRFLRSPGSDYLAAALIGVATFSKPIHICLILPLLALAAWRRQRGRTIRIGLVFAGMLGGLFLANVAISGEFNYQGGDRKTFYGQTGFPFANERETFETTGQDRATDRVPVDVLFNENTGRVLRHNILYFLVGRYSGLLPYFFPGVLSALLFLTLRHWRQPWQWLTGGIAVLAALALLVYMPFTYSGGGGPIGNRYYLSFYPLFLFLTPPLAGFGSGLAALGVGSLFTAKLLFNPVYTLSNPGAHAERGLHRVLPIELTLLNDLPVAADRTRSRLALAGAPPVLVYFPDENAFGRQGDRFWVRGRSRADVILRAPVWRHPDGDLIPLRLDELRVEIRNGHASNRVTIGTGADRRSVDLEPREVRIVPVRMDEGVPYRPFIYPTNYVYAISIRSARGYVPFLEVAGQTDSRYLSARIRIVPVYVDPTQTVHAGR